MNFTLEAIAWRLGYPPFPSKREISTTYRLLRMSIPNSSARRSASSAVISPPQSCSNRVLTRAFFTISSSDASFRKETLCRLCSVICSLALCRAAKRSLPATGFRRYWSTPTQIACRASSKSSYPLTMMILSQGMMALAWRASVSPSMNGILMSVIRISGFRSRMMESASSPSPASPMHV